MRTLFLLLALALSAFAEPRIVKLATPPTVTIDGRTIPAPGFVALGGGYYDAEARAILPAGAVIVSTSSTSATIDAEGKPATVKHDRFENLPAADKPHVLVATAYRSKDGSDLRAQSNASSGGNLGAKVPASGKTSAQPDAADKADDVHARARAAHAAGSADKLRIPMSQVRSGDVVEEDSLVPHRWAGE